MRQIFQCESLEWHPHVGIVSNVVWCDLGGERLPPPASLHALGKVTVELSGPYWKKWVSLG